MVSTPPKHSEAWRAWAEDQIIGLVQGEIVRDTRVQAVIQGATNVGNSAANAIIEAGKANQAVKGLDSTNRVARPLSDSTFWREVISGTHKVWNGSEQPTNASYEIESGVPRLVLTPTADVGAFIDLVPLTPVPTSKKLHIRVGTPTIPSSNPSIEITVRNVDGSPVADPYQPPIFSGMVGTVPLADHPALATGQFYYTVRALRNAGEQVGSINTANVFEVIGSGDGLNIGPGGISVEDSSGNKTVEINPSAPLLSAPTAPILDSGGATVTVRWDGRLVLNVDPPARFSYVRVEEANSPTGPWTRTGQPLNKAGNIITRPPVASHVYYRFIAVDTSNRESAVSAVSDIIVAGVREADLDTLVADALEQASSDSSEAKTIAANAQTTATNAQTAATDAASAAANAAGIANGKGKVIIQSATPAAEDQLAQNLWIDTTGGLNTPKRWDGSAWTAVTDKAATDAAAAAAAAQTKADQAFTQATTAATAAGNAQTSADAKNRVWYQAEPPAGTGHKVGDTWFDTDGGNKIHVWNGSIWSPTQDADIVTAKQTAIDAAAAAANAQTTANGKNRVVRSTSDASLPANYVAGDQWWKYSGTQITGMWIHDGSAWVAQTLTDSVITNLDAGTIKTGTLSADRVGANSLTVSKIAVTDFTNMTPGGGFDSPVDLANWIDASNGSASIAYGVGNVNNSAGGLFVGGGSGTRYILQTFPVRSGDKYRFIWDQATTATYNGTASNGKLRLGDGKGTPGSILTAWAWGAAGQGWTTRSEVYTVPAGVTSLSVSLSFDHTDGTVKIDNFSVRLMNSAELLVDGSVTANVMAANSITAANGAIADLAVTNAKIANMDAAKITTGYLDVANRVRANSIATSQLLVSNLTNLVDDPSFEVSTPGVAWTYFNGAGWRNTNARTGTGCVYLPAGAFGTMAQAVNAFQVEGGEQYRLSAWVRTASGTQASGTGRVGLRFTFGSSATTLDAVADRVFTAQGTSTTWTYITNTWTVPAGVKFARVDIIRDGTTLNYYIDDISLSKMSDGSLIVDGAIDGKVITGAVIQSSGLAERGVKLDTNGIAAYNSTGVKTVDISAITGNAAITGTLRTGNAEENGMVWVGGPAAADRGAASFHSAGTLGAYSPPQIYADAAAGELFLASKRATSTSQLGWGAFGPGWARLAYSASGNTATNLISLEADRMHVVAPKMDIGATRIEANHYPWAVAMGKISGFTVAAGAVQTFAITFPSGRFTQAPVAVVGQTGTNVRDVTQGTMSVTTSGMTVWVGSNSTTSRTVSVDWVAMQKSSISAVG